MAPDLLARTTVRCPPAALLPDPVFVGYSLQQLYDHDSRVLRAPRACVVREAFISRLQRFHVIWGANAYEESGRKRMAVLTKA